MIRKVIHSRTATIQILITLVILITLLMRRVRNKKTIFILKLLLQILTLLHMKVVTLVVIRNHNLRCKARKSQVRFCLLTLKTKILNQLNSTK